MQVRAIALTLSVALIAGNATLSNAQQGVWLVGMGMGSVPRDRQRVLALAPEVGLRLIGGQLAGLGASAISGFVVSPDDRVCTLSTAVSPCDVRSLSGFVGATAWANASAFAGGWEYYGRAGFGPWWGHDRNAQAGQSTAERGGVITLEMGTHDGRLDVGIEQKRLEGSRFGALPLMNVVVRVAF